MALEQVCSWCREEQMCETSKGQGGQTRSPQMRVNRTPLCSPQLAPSDYHLFGWSTFHNQRQSSESHFGVAPRPQRLCLFCMRWCTYETNASTFMVTM
ncbi:hypothetical protein AVEN_86862-1 [Araneus ventricosus]|uniref:Uncharacterized protein n=1 Tax=Araneus ventricosus TaxID=182803 RepID=A0A4Y2P0U3_ARAVE|nr:hypothetical protein AVEN_86862-1 [Araneus ventricosus]